MKTYRIYGLTLRSQIPLPAVERDDSEPIDLTLRYGPARAIPWHPESGELLALYEAKESGFALTRDSRGYRARFYGLCDFEIDLELSTLTASLTPDTDESFASILL